MRDGIAYFGEGFALQCCIAVLCGWCRNVVEFVDVTKGIFASTNYKVDNF